MVPSFDGPKPASKAPTTTASTTKRKREPTPNVDECVTFEDDEGEMRVYHGYGAAMCAPYFDFYSPVHRRRTGKG